MCLTRVQEGDFIYLVSEDGKGVMGLDDLLSKYASQYWETCSGKFTPKFYKYDIEDIPAMASKCLFLFDVDA